MLLFEKLYYKNLLSTGNSGITIHFDKHSTTLVQGMSGSGKSTMIDALCFGLYGKPFRNINKPSLVNSINQKECVVEVTFSTNGIKYLIRRGIKPTIFEIYANGQLINQNAALKDYQKVLEQQILRMSMKTFTQITILGSSSYTPFMELSAANRREVIEDILDIGIFSVMNTLLKSQIQESKEQQIQLDANLKVYKERALSLKKMIDLLTSNQNNDVLELEHTISELQKEIDSYNDEILQLKQGNLLLQEENPDVIRLTEFKKENTNIQNTLSEIAAEKRQYKKTIDFFLKKDVCPTCTQFIPEEYKKTTIKLFEEKLKEVKDKILEIETTQQHLIQKINKLDFVLDDIEKNDKKMMSIDSFKAAAENSLNVNLERLKKKKIISGDITQSKKDMKDCANKFLELKEEKKQLFKVQEIQEAVNKLLKDTGIKTAIIREYLPMINKFLNLFLQQMDMFINFYFDESFNEIIKSRYRDTFSYGNFSAGEQLRISLAILFTWRHIAKVKNSAATSLLIFDEILTGKLDNTNTDILINMINEIAAKDTNIFVIAHGDGLCDKLGSILKFEKQGDFSIMVE